MERYKAILAGNSVYREIELIPDMRQLRVGTRKSCHYHLDSGAFFEDFELRFENDGKAWTLHCGEECFLSPDGVLKQSTKLLEHGDEVVVKFHHTGQSVGKISFVLDFDYETPDYLRIINIDSVDALHIGGHADCDICLLDPLAQGDYISLEKKQGAWQVYDPGTRYGCYINGSKVLGVATLRDYDFLSIVGYSFYLNHGKLYTSRRARLQAEGLSVQDVYESTEAFDYPKFNHGTRIKVVVPEVEIALLDPPAPLNKPEPKILTTLLPAVAGLGITIFLRSALMSSGNNSMVILMAATGALGVATTIIGFITNGSDYRKGSAKRIEDYMAYIEKKKAVIAQRREQEAQILEEIYFSPRRLFKTVENFTSDLFNRTPKDEDFLHVRLGTGMVPSRQPVSFKEQETFESEDPLANVPQEVANEFKYVARGPIVVPFASANAIGVVGVRKRLYSMMKTMLLDICVRQFYQDVQVFIFTSADHAAKFDWARLMPHLQNDNMRNVVCDDDSRNILFEYLYKLLSARQASAREAEENAASFPNIVIFAYDDVGIKSHPLSQFIEHAGAIGVTFVFFEEKKELLPVGCSQVISLKNGEDGGVLINTQDATRALSFAYEPLDELQAAYIAEKLAPVYCEEISLEASLTKNITLFELLEIYSVDDLNIAERWNKSQIHKSMAAPLGVKSGNEVVCLDLHEKYHGPHGLVAGTTGSGKSEILQSYILSMATLFHPYEVSFVIIDFKGGGMVNQFKDLPHLNGAITNIDGREIDRSLLSIKAELKKRQALFAQHDTNHINQYIRLFKSGKASIPLPHLILVVDEFAELKMDQPEFMKELISAARIGRSLGVHLILATQKPSGVVDAQIWSNSKFKLCLKVQNKEDSKEVLKTPLAAEIKEPGRAYLQVGNNEIFELFQSAYSGAPAEVDAQNKKKYTIYELSAWGRRTPIYEQKPDKSSAESHTQLDAIVDHVAEHCEKEGIARLPGICLPSLEENIYLSELTFETPERQQGLFALMGYYDDPERQLQQEYVLNIEEGNIIVVGASVMGKTTWVQTFLYSLIQNYTPQDVNFYIIDGGNMALKLFEGSRHVGGVALLDEDEKIKNLFRLLRSFVATRKKAFVEKGIGTYAAYIEAGYRDLPQVVLVLDNAAAFKEYYPDSLDELTSLSREGLSLGISIVITASQSNTLNYRTMSNFSQKIALACNDKSEYTSLLGRCRMEPKNVPGRALMVMDKRILEYQTALCVQAEKEIDRVSAIRTFLEQRNAECTGERAVRIPMVPEQLSAEVLLREQPELYKTPYQVPICMRYQDVSLFSLDLYRVGMLTMLGENAKARLPFLTGLLGSLQSTILHNLTQAYILDSAERPLREFAQLGCVAQYTSDASEAILILEGIHETLLARQERVSASDGEAEEVLREEALLMVVLENQQLLQQIYADKELMKKVLEIGRQLRQYKACILFTGWPNEQVGFSAPELAKVLKEQRQGILLTGIANCRAYDASGKEQRALAKTMGESDAILFFGTEEAQRVKLLVP